MEFELSNGTARIGDNVSPKKCDKNCEWSNGVLKRQFGMDVVSVDVTDSVDKVVWVSTEKSNLVVKKKND